MKNLYFQKLVRVREEDLLQMEALRQAAREGRLFILPAEVINTSKREESIQSILTYVERIDGFSEEAYRPHMHDIWEAILRSEPLKDLFVLHRGKTNRGNPNFYRVTVTVEYHQAIGVYRTDILLPDLHRKMELIKENDPTDSHYLSKGRYPLNDSEKSAISGIVRKFLPANYQQFKANRRIYDERKNV